MLKRNKVCDMKVFENLISFLWIFTAGVFGLIFIKNNYEIGVNSEYNVQSIPFAVQLVFAIIAFAISSIIILNIVKFIFKAFEKDSPQRHIILYALPVIIILTSVFLCGFVRNNIGYYIGDEKNIWDAAVRLYPFFFVYTSELYLVTFFIIPCTIAPSIIKILATGFVFGYSIQRINRYYKTKAGCFIYLLFLMIPFYRNAVEVHRMHWYSIIYLAICVKLYFDKKENCEITKKQFLYITLVIALLTTLRREGIYLVIFGLLILLYTYVDCQKFNRTRIVKMTLFYLAIELMVYVPPMVWGGNLVEKGQTINSYMARMLQEPSFDRESVSKELDIINGYLNIQRLDDLNSYLGINAHTGILFYYPDYEDGRFYAFYDNPTTSMEDAYNAIMTIAIKQPICFLKSRIRSFCAAAMSYSSENIFLPLLLIISIWIRALLNRNYSLLILTSGVLIHMGLTTIGMPCAWVKYFLEAIYFAYVFTIIEVIDYVKCIEFHSDEMSR